ncbi:MFS transporter [Actinoplanes sp. RD1]|uniref:MFS transporter n=1 Tax=Actinoplanes sp. RD1 TaxID=3064538 RepID=UPI0027416260|nr:MFS transporter [Actinoplanes sp. RD1]
MSVLAPLRIKPYRFLLAGRTVNALGSAVAPVALAFAVLDLTGSASDLGLVVGARVLTNVLFLLFGGTLADRLPRYLLMVGSSGAAAVTQGAVALLVLSGTATVPLLILLAALNGMVSALALPASSAILPELVPAEFRQQANALNRLCFNGAAILGAPLGGILVAVAGAGWGIAVDAGCFLVAALLFARLRPGTVRSAVKARAGIFVELREGWTEFRSRTWLWVVVLAFMVINACLSGGINVLGPVIADDTIGRQLWGVVLGAQTLGMALGAIVAMRLRVRRMLFFGAVSTAFLALPMLALGVVPHIVPLLGAMFVAGLMIEQFSVAWETTMQEHVPADRLARVYSYDMVGSFLAIPVGQITAGPVAEAVGVEATLVGAAVLVVVAVGAMVASRDVRTLRHGNAPVEELAA